MFFVANKQFNFGSEDFTILLDHISKGLIIGEPVKNQEFVSTCFKSALAARLFIFDRLIDAIPDLTPKAWLKVQLVIYTRDWFRELLQIFLNNNVSEICNVLFDVAHKRHGSSYFPVFWMNLKN